MEALSGDDQKAYDAAMNLKKQGVSEFTKPESDKDAALKFMSEALEEIKKVQNRNSNVGTLESNIC